MMPPYSLSFESFLMILFSLFSTIDAKKNVGFLFICLGDGCEGWQTALTILSIVVIFSVFLCWICLKCSGDQSVEDVQGQRIGDITMQRRPQEDDEREIK